MHYFSAIHIDFTCEYILGFLWYVPVFDSFIPCNILARDLEVLPKAPPPPPRKLSEKEMKVLRDKEESTLRELRIFLREVINKVVKDRKFYIFARPVDVEEVGSSFC